MKKQKKVVCVIPARLASTRFPRKMLSQLHGRPLLEWVWDAANAVRRFDDIIFAVDAEEIAAQIKSFGGKFVMTSVDCNNGTERLVELVIHGKIDADILVNWQGDEPFIIPSMIDALLQSINNESEEIWTLKKLIQDPKEIFSPNVAKVVCDKQGFVLYFSRAPIPFFRDEHDPAVLITKKVYYKHVGIYAYTPQALGKIALIKNTALAEAEKLEMIPLLENNLKIRVHETEYDVFGIDVPEDLLRAEQRIHLAYKHK